jgi:hypothetical protein
MVTGDYLKIVTHILYHEYRFIIDTVVKHLFKSNIQNHVAWSVFIILDHVSTCTFPQLMLSGKIIIHALIALDCLFFHKVSRVGFSEIPQDLVFRFVGFGNKW